MKYYDFCSKGSSIILKSGKQVTEHLSLSVVDIDTTFNSKHSAHCFSLEKFVIKEPIKIQAHYYMGEAETIEDDLVSAGNPQVVSEEFKKLVEELDPQAAQFFETENTNCKTKKKYYVMHVTKAISCLDESRSKIFHPQPGSLLGRSIAVGMVDVRKISENDHIFRLGENVQVHYISDKFYKEWKKRKLTGCLFNLRS